MVDIALFLGLCINNSTCDFSPIFNSNLTSNYGVNYDVLFNKELLEGSESIKSTNLAALAKDLAGKTLRVTTLEDYPLSYTRMVNGTLVGNGIAFELFDFLHEKFKFDYTIVLPENNIVGSTDDSAGSIINMLDNDKADVAVSFLPILADARRHLLYSTSLDEGEWVMVMIRPGESASGAGLLAPFDRTVWTLIFVSLVLVGPLIYLLIVIRYRLTKDATERISLPHCVWFVYGALLKQGSVLSPNADSTRIIFSSWWLFITVLTSFYTANLTAFLTLSKFTLPINNPQDLMKQEKQFVTHRGGCIEYAIKNPEEQLNMLRPLVDKRLADFTKSLNDTEILLYQVQKKKFVFIRDRPAVDHLIYEDYRIRKTLSKTDEKVHCPFATTEEPFIRRKRAFAYPKDSKWNLLFDPQLLYLVESGIVKYKLKEGLPRAPICPQNLGGTERQLRLGDLSTTYVMMLTGFSSAGLLFGSEVFFRIYQARKLGNKEMVAKTKRIFVRPKENLKNNLATQSPPPPYATLYNRFNKNDSNVTHLDSSSKENETRKTINGREYMVVKNSNGTQLIPIRAPSAAIFQYTYNT